MTNKHARPPLTKEEFLKRCANAYDMGLASFDILQHLHNTYDAMHRLEGGQFHYFAEFIEAESVRTERFSSYRQLANDKLGYDVIKFLAILIHPCQICAESPEEWHTRSGFCPHRKLI